jgi:hypothetical protein
MGHHESASKSAVICVTIKQSYNRVMVTQITLKTEGPHGLPSGRRTEDDPLYPGLIILTVYDCGHAFQLPITREE